jgi:hypothetical protein
MEPLPEWALTLYQPWAWLVAAGYKPIENRPRTFAQKKFRGDFWIHAGAVPSRDDWADRWGAAHDLCVEILGYDPMAEAGIAYGAIIGRATITGIVPPRHALLGKHDPAPVVPWHFPDQYGFKVENANLLATPVPCRGWQGFWRVREPELEKLKEAA